MTQEDIMKLALEEAGLAVRDGNAPFACIVLDKEGDVVAKDHDRVKELMDPTAHGEVNAVRSLCKQLNSLSLKGYTFYTTSEPCPTCMTAMIKTEVSTVYYGAKTEETASLPIPAEFIASKSLKHPISVTGGILAKETLEQRNRLLAVIS
jgi:tRNA(Arg) A34 adenosine deaminase TadA